MRLHVYLIGMILFLACNPRDPDDQVMALMQPVMNLETVLTPSVTAGTLSDFRTKENILAYFDELIANEQLIVGQQCGDSPDQTNGYYQNFVASLAGETNKYAGIVGADLGFYPGTAYPVNTLIRHWEEGGLVTVSWHADNPFANGFDVSWSAVENGKEINLSAILRRAPESTVKSSYRKELDAVAGALQKLRDAGVVVLWRPFPQMNGDQFWWGINAYQDQQTNVQDFTALWQDLYETLTYDYGLDNLLWTYSVMPQLGWNAPGTAYYPGSDYVDLVGMEYYGPHPDFPDFQSLHSLGKTLVISETGPSGGSEGTWDELQLISVLAGKAAYFLQWHSYPGTALAIVDNLKSNAMMNSERVITRDEIGIKPQD